MDKYKAGEVVTKTAKYGIVDKKGIEYTGIVIGLKEGDTFPPVEQDDNRYFEL